MRTSTTRLSLLLCSALLIGAAVAQNERVTVFANSLCSPPPAGMAGAFTPVNPPDVPAGLPQLVTDFYFDTSADAPTGCGNTTAVVLEACSQLAEGTNYQLMLSVYCTDRTSDYKFDGNLAWLTLLANVTVPLAGEPEVGSVELYDVYVEPERQCPSPEGSTHSGNFSFIDPTTVPQGLPLLVVDAFLERALSKAPGTLNSESPSLNATFTGCDDYSADVVEACQLVVEGEGTYYHVFASGQCLDEDSVWDNGVMRFGLKAEVLVTESGSQMEVKALSMFGAVPKPLPPLIPSPAASD